MASADPLLDRIDRTLDQLLQLAEGAPAGLLEAMRYSLLAPGKRLRPRLVLLACVAAGGIEAQALPAAGAVEMVHAYSLIHDDLPAMDDDDLRRGRPTCHKVFGEATAILAGDALLTLAFHVMSESYLPRIAALCCQELARAAGASGMVGGQMMDLAWEERTDAALADVERVHAAKTGALFRACLRIGGIVAHSERPSSPDACTLSALDHFGRAFGLLFQITDDLLDVEGDAATAGKRVGKDADRGKLTYPGLLGVDESRRRASQYADEAVAAVAPLGQAATPLMELARAVRDRDR